MVHAAQGKPLGVVCIGVSMREFDHLKKRWVPIVGDNGKIHIVTIGKQPWFVCMLFQSLPNDDSGIVAAHRICDLHNEKLSKESVGCKHLEPDNG